MAGKGPHLEHTLSSKDGAREQFWPFTFTTKACWDGHCQWQHCSKQILKVQFPHFRVLPKGTTASS